MSDISPTPVAFDPEVAAVLDVARVDMPALASEGEIPAARAQFALEAPTDEELARDGLFRIEEIPIPGPTGAPEISLLICTPTAVRGPVPVIYHIHSGGMILGDFRNGLLHSLDWAEEFGTAVVSVQYRLAPEAKGTALVDDCYAGLLWTARNAERLGLDADRLIVAGVSGGGGLAAGLALLARDLGEVSIAAQILVCPMLDDRNDSISAVQMTGFLPWDRHSNATGWGAVLGEDRGTDSVSPYVAPARAENLSNLPPTFIDVGSAETFRDEAVEYARRIWAAGGAAELHVWSGGSHGFDFLAPAALISQQAREARRGWLRRHFSQVPKHA